MFQEVSEYAEIRHDMTMSLFQGKISDILIWCLRTQSLLCVTKYEPPHEISNNVVVRPAKPQMSLHIFAV